MPKQPDFIIRVDIPALEAYVQILKETGASQAKINALTATATALNERLLAINSSLKAAIDRKPHS